ncbi:MAG: HAMP domain-containing histidine kinase [Actinomycetia bacterium]|nr:HAMP domain-containing histidine kinase [Actinomycetes bacterium]
MKRLDLRTRLLSSVGLVVILQIVVAFAVISVTRNHLVDQIDDRLAVAGSPERVPDTDPPRHDSRGEANDRSQPERLGDTYEGVLTADGSLFTYFAPNTTGTELPPPEIDLDRAESSRGRPITVAATDGELHYRLTARREAHGDFTITAIPLDGVHATMSRLVAVVALTAATVSLALALVTWWVLRLGIAPIKRMTTTAEAIAAGDLSERIGDVDQSTEAGQLGDALNTMLSRIETSFDERTRAEGRLRQFIADASHELRTPVATIRGYAELYRAGGLGDRAELDDAMRRTEQESQRMSRLIADMLNLAKLDHDPALTTHPVDLTTLTRDTATDAQATYPERTVTTTFPDGPLIVEGDEDLLRQALTNVVGNAVVHTDATATVNVVLSRKGTLAVIEVVDNGDGMTSDVVARTTERFYRADPSRSRHKGGSGLGLAIVDTVISAHHGTLHIYSRPGSGTTVTITLPLNGQRV